MIRYAEECVQANGCKILTYAKYGHGKTVMLATAPAPLLISAEAGVLSMMPDNIARIYGPDRKDVTYRVPCWQLNTIADLGEVFQFLLRSKEARNFRTIGLDSLSEIAEKFLGTAKTGEKDPRRAYGNLYDIMDQVIRDFRDLPYNVYMTAKMELVKNELTGAVKYGPSMPGSKYSQQLGHFFDEVFYLGVGTTPEGVNYRYLQTQPDNFFDAKDRSGMLAMYEPADLSLVINKMTRGR